MGRQPCCDKVGLKRGPWTVEEDHKLANFILHNGIHCWRSVPKLAGLLRCGKSCRLRWINYLRPDLKRGGFTEAEEDQIVQLHALLGNKWSKIASHFPGRTDNEIKNHWNTRIKKKMKLRGIDPVSHKPIQQAEEADHKRLENVAPDSSTSEEQEQMTGSEKSTSQEQDDENARTDGHKQEETKVLVAETGTGELLKSCEMLYGELDLGSVWQGEANTSSSSYSCSFSLKEYSSPVQQWVDSVESFLSWSDLNPIQEDFIFLGDGQWN